MIGGSLNDGGVDVDGLLLWFRTSRQLVLQHMVVGARAIAWNWEDVFCFAFWTLWREKREGKEKKRTDDVMSSIAYHAFKLGLLDISNARPTEEGERRERERERERERGNDTPSIIICTNTILEAFHISCINEARHALLSTCERSRESFPMFG
jgi:hypothetical protein